MFARVCVCVPLFGQTSVFVLQLRRGRGGRPQTFQQIHKTLAFSSPSLSASLSLQTIFKIAMSYEFLPSGVL